MHIATTWGMTPADSRLAAWCDGPGAVLDAAIGWLVADVRAELEELLPATS